MKFPVIEPIRDGKRRYKPGDEISLDPVADEREIMRLVMAGAIRDVRPTAHVDSDKDQGNAATNADEQKDTEKAQAKQSDQPKAVAKKAATKTAAKTAKAK